MIILPTLQVCNPDPTCGPEKMLAVTSLITSKCSTIRYEDTDTSEMCLLLSLRDGTLDSFRVSSKKGAIQPVVGSIYMYILKADRSISGWWRNEMANEVNDSCFKQIIDNPYFQNVSSEFIALFLLVLFGYFFYRMTGRRKLLSFFHVGQDKRFIIYLSSVNVTAGGSVGVDGRPRSFAGPTFALTEVYLIGLIQRLFNYITPGVDSLPGFLKSILISDVTVDFLPSPPLTTDVDTQVPYLALGSPGYNSASQRIQADYNPLAQFETNNVEIMVNNLGKLSDPRLGFLVRARNNSTGQIAYYAAGPASIGTTGTAIYLIKNWRNLQKRFGNDTPFVVLLRFMSDDPRQVEVVAEKAQK